MLRRPFTRPPGVPSRRSGISSLHCCLDMPVPAAAAHGRGRMILYKIFIGTGLSPPPSPGSAPPYWHLRHIAGDLWQARLPRTALLYLCARIRGTLVADAVTKHMVFRIIIPPLLLHLLQEWHYPYGTVTGDAGQALPAPHLPAIQLQTRHFLQQNSARVSACSIRIFTTEKTLKLNNTGSYFKVCSVRFK